MKGRSAFEQGLRGVLKSHHIESTGDVQEVKVSDGLAYCLTLLTVRITPIAGGDANVRSGNTLSIFRKQRDGSWLLVRDANLLPSAA